VARQVLLDVRSLEVVRRRGIHHGFEPSQEEKSMQERLVVRAIR